MILLRLRPSYKASPTIGKDAGGKLKLEPKIMLHWIDPIRVIKREEGFVLVARTVVLVTTADWILMWVREDS